MRTYLHWRLRRLAAVMMGLAAGASLRASQITANDLFVGGWLAEPNTSGIVRIDTKTGTESLISSGGLLADLFGVYYDSPTSLLAVTPGWGNNGRVVRVDVNTGAQTLVASDLGQATALAVAADGTLYVPNEGWYGSSGDIKTIDLGTGTTTTLPTGGRPGRIIYASDGHMYTEGTPYPWEGGSTHIDRLDLSGTSATLTPITSGGYLTSGGWMAEDKHGDILVTDPGSLSDLTDSKIVSVDTQTHTQTLIASGVGENLNGLWINGSGSIYVSDWGNPDGSGMASIYRLNEANGNLTLFKTSSYLVHGGAITGMPTRQSVPDSGDGAVLLASAMVMLAVYLRLAGGATGLPSGR